MREDLNLIVRTLSDAAAMLRLSDEFRARGDMLRSSRLHSAALQATDEALRLLADAGAEPCRCFQHKAELGQGISAELVAARFERADR